MKAHRRERAQAATALFRLAEIRLAQGKTETATALYREYLTAFSDLEPQAKLLRGQLAALGGTDPQAPPAASDEESENLQRLKRFATSAPDVVTDPKELLASVEKNLLTVRGQGYRLQI